MNEIKMWGRGGQGTVMAAEILAFGLAEEGKWVAAFPSFGPERRGAPVDAFIRFNDRKVINVSEIIYPDCLAVFDRMRAISTPEDPQIKKGGMLILNVPIDFKTKPYKGLKNLAKVDATAIAVQEIGRDISNSGMLGALAKVTGWLSLSSLEKGLKEHFKGKLLDVNVRCLHRGYDEVEINQGG